MMLIDAGKHKNAGAFDPGLAGIVKSVVGGSVVIDVTGKMKTVTVKQTKASVCDGGLCSRPRLGWSTVDRLE